jgi:hypothetical protein
MSQKLIFLFYNDIDPILQHNVALTLLSEWKVNFKEGNVKTADDLINILKEMYLCLVVIDENTDFIGTICVKIDTPNETFNTNYWICNLFVTERHRGTHIGHDILSLTEWYMFTMKNISVLHLWCDKTLTEFYRKKNWILSEEDSKNMDIKIMVKMISSHLQNNNLIVFQDNYFEINKASFVELQSKTIENLNIPVMYLSNTMCQLGTANDCNTS